MTQEDLAGQAEVDRTYVSGVERETINPSVDLIERMADALGVDIAELFIRLDPHAPKPEPLKAGRKPLKPSAHD